MPEIPEGYVAIPKADHDLYARTYKLFGQIYDDKEHGLAVKKALKAADASVRIPEIDVAEPLLAPIRERQDAIEAENKALKEQLEKDKEERETQRAVGDLQSRIDKAASKFRLTPEGISKMKEIMAEKQIGDPEIVAEHIVSNIERAKPVTGSNFGPADLNVLGIDGKSEDDSTKLLHSDPLRWMDKEVPNILAEFEQEAA